VAPLAIGRRFNVPAFLQRLADLSLGKFFLLREILARAARLPVFGDKRRWLHVVRFPIEIVDLVVGPEKIFRVPMTFQAPRHAVRLGLIHHGHVIDLAVATETADAAIDVGGMIVKNVIGRAMDLDPRYRLAAFPARAHRFELRIVLRHLGVAIHARLRVGQIGMRRHVDKTVAVTAIHAQLRDMNVVREGHRLDWLITDTRIFWRPVVPGRGRQSADDDHAADGDLERYPIGPAREKVRHRRLEERRTERPPP
jgi:hypothetical protein